MIEERVAPAQFDGTNVRDGFTYRKLTPSDIKNWGLGVEPTNLVEIQSLLGIETFVEVPLLLGCSFKRKDNADKTLDKYKARIVAKGFNQRYGEDYTMTFSPVVRHSTLQIVLVIVIQRRMKRLQLDIKTLS
ncbi:hypothetical protein PC128_g22575 [Phytophthora cactorum]|nr:hypothetical protein PC128_g22575 [Phytophthora cactorum]